MKLRLGLLGGMFDPPHVGHIESAKHAASRLRLDKVKLIPCKTPNHRPHTQVSAEHRVNMLRLAIKAESLLAIDTLELEREGVSYMVDTLEQLRAQHSDGMIVLILGMDSFNSLPNWHRYEDILSLCHLFVLSRSAEQASPETESALAGLALKVSNEEQLDERQNGCYLIDNNFSHDASSTLVRSERVSGKNSGLLLHPDVSNYIESHHLYQETPSTQQRCTG